ncbi:hypothetical protein PoB_002226500 [Plakobranchus ocellatus]|uniref:Uncharacterized protein n=1 Tax=Plakobranchus ocellatus TaxID=259542 RepID=A0AAV3ZKT6_9GAST|nr:hypothetical protein PoB_002226500 [Plakobranchus ocellatus]
MRARKWSRIYHKDISPPRRRWLKPVTGGSPQISGQIRYPLCHPHPQLIERWRNIFIYDCQTWVQENLTVDKPRVPRFLQRVRDKF